jgi:uncharacterized protein YkwD
MAATNTLAHNPNRETQTSNWRALGENVGTGRATATIESALVASPSHLTNLLSPSFVEVGYGTAVAADGRIYLDEVFRTPLGSSCGGSTAVALAPVKQARPSAPASRPTTPTPRASTPSSASTTPAVATPTPTPTPTVHPSLDRAVVLARLARPVIPPADEDSIGRAFGFHQTFAQAIRP